MTPTEQQDVRSLAAYFTRLGSRVVWDGDRVRSIAIFGEDIQDKHLSDLRGFPGLTEVNLTRSHVTDAGMFYLGKLTELQCLLLGGTAITDEGFEQLGRLTQLETLNLIGTAVTDEGLQYFRDATLMKELWLERTDITDRALELLSAYPRLEFLDVTNTLITDAGLRTIGERKTLQELCLSACPDLTPAAFSCLENLEALTGLWADSCAVLPQSLQHLTKLPLQIVSLNWTGLSDEALTILAQIPTLKEVHMLGTQVTDEGADAFRTTHPDCKLHYSPIYSP